MKPTTTLAKGQTPDGAPLLLQEHDGEFYMSIGGVPLMSTRASSSEQEMADLACAEIPPESRVLIGGLGFGFTLRRVLELLPDDGVVEVAELLPQVVDWNRQFLAEVNGSLLDDPRVRVELRDVFELVTGAGGCRYDAILLDVDNSPDPLVQQGNARLYGRQGLKTIQSTLRPGGRVVFWSANQDGAFARLLGEAFSEVKSLPVKAYAKARRYSHTLFVAVR